MVDSNAESIPWNWRIFFNKAGVDWPNAFGDSAVGGGPERHLFVKFRTVTPAHKQSLFLLLVDSEGPVAPGHTVWQHLRNRDPIGIPTTHWMQTTRART